MAVKLLQVLVLGVIAAAAVDDVPVTWVPPPRATLPCLIPDADRIQLRRPPPPLEGTRPRAKPYLWRRDGEIIRNTSGSLEVSRRRDPEAVYQCMVRHLAGDYVLGYPINLRYAYLSKEVSTVPKGEATAWLGQPFVIKCQVDSGPAAVISWLRDGEPLPDDARYQYVKNQLIITEVKEEDDGAYRCKAYNALANRSRISQEVDSLQLTVEEPPEHLKVSFLQVEQDATIEVPRGSRVALPCYVIGKPRPQLIWELTPPGGEGRTGELESTEELFLMPSAQPDQAGGYVCRVQGHHDLTKTFNVTIATSVNMTHAPESRSAARASTVRFNCTASGEPSARVSWYKDGRPIRIEGRYEIVPYAEDKSLMQLLIRSVTSEDAGIYQCFARNSASVTSAWARLNVTGGEVAAAPDDVRCWPAGARDVLLRWRPMDDVVAYTVHTTTPDGSSLPSQPVTIPETLITVRSPLTPYSFQVQAFLRSAAGDKNTATHISNISKSVTCQGQGVPIKLSKAGDDSVLVSWREFYIEHRGVKQWILQHKAENSSNEHNVTLDENVYNYTLKVSPDEGQQVRVLGSRSVPWLHQNLTLVPWTATSAAGHYLPPGEVRAVPEDVEVTAVNARNFTVRWRCEEDSLLTYSYMVCTRRQGGDDDCIESLVKSALVSNLQPNSEYEVRVQARLPGQILGGDFSSPIQVTTPSEGQEKFRNLTYKFVNATAAKVSWISDLRDYTVRHTYDYTMPMTQWTAVEATGNTALLTGLDPTKELIVIVQGNGPFSQSPVLTIPAQIPEATDLRYEYVDKGLKVSWTGEGPRVVRYSQNLTQPLYSWPTLDVEGSFVEIPNINQSLHTFVMVAAPGTSARNQVLTIKPRPPPEPMTTDKLAIYIGTGITVGLIVLCVLSAVAVCAWRKRKRARGARRGARGAAGEAAGGEEMKNIGDRLANGGGSKDAGEPLLNGHVTITDNPSQSKTPNGKVRKEQRFENPFDVARYEDCDVTAETDLEPDTTYHLLDTSRVAEYEVSANKLPDDNMNSEVTRGFALDSSKVLPTLQPNG